MAACLPYLLEQIRLMDPKLILLVGATAVQDILGSKVVGKTGISKLRGQWYPWQDTQGKERLCMPIFHPSYLLRNQSREKGSPKWLTWQDMQAVRTKYDELIF
jgi:DNA polymerase